MMIDSNRFYALAIGLLLLITPDARAQHAAPEAYAATDVPAGLHDRSSLPTHDAGTRELAEAPSDHAATVTMLNGLASLGSAAWPTVRTYLWESCFAGHDLFSGFALSRPGHEVSDVVTFLLIIDKEAWEATSSASRQTTLLQTGTTFKDRLAELGLKGSLEIVLMSR